MTENNKAASDGQFKKQMGIAYSNANNAAIELMKAEPKLFGFGIPQMMGNLKEIRTYMLDDYMEWYNNVISKVGSNFKPEDTIKRLETASSSQELKSIWFSLSEDERLNPEIVKATKKLKEKYETA